MKITITFLFVLILSITVFGQTKLPPEGIATRILPEVYSSVFDIKDFNRYYILIELRALGELKKSENFKKAISKVIEKEESLKPADEATDAQFFIQYKESDTGSQMKVFYVKDKKVVVVWAETRIKKASETEMAEAFLEVLQRNKKLIQPGIVPSPQSAPETGDGFETVQPIDNSSRENSASSDSQQLTGAVLKGTALSLPQPVYPNAARAERAQGAVKVQVVIDERGNVIEATAVSGHQLLRGAAEAAARRATFKPTTLEGQPVSVTGVIVYNFIPK